MSEDIDPNLAPLTLSEGLAPSLLAEISSLIDSTRSHVAQTVNTELALLYWKIGERINRDILGRERAE